jgi:hypothetical protein
LMVTWKVGFRILKPLRSGGGRKGRGSELGGLRGPWGSARGLPRRRLRPMLGKGTWHAGPSLRRRLRPVLGKGTSRAGPSLRRRLRPVLGKGT